MIWVWRHRLSWDLTGVADRDERATIQGALNACSYPFSRVRKRTGKRVPVTVSDLSRFNDALTSSPGAHAHVHDEDGTEGHLLGDPTPVGSRAAALGLYWLPTPPAYPAGRVELDRGLTLDKPLMREVFLAEAAHAVDYGAMTEAQRLAIRALFDLRGTGRAPAGWFEEEGEENYYAWRGERWMGLFMASFAPTLPRPLEPRQPWLWSYDASDVAAARRILR